MTFSNLKKEAVRKFNKKFILRPFEPDGDWSWSNDAIPWKIKDFWLFEIDRVVSCVVEIIEEMKSNIPPYPVEESMTDGINEAMRDGARIGYYQALDDLLQKLSSLKEK